MKNPLLFLLVLVILSSCATLDKVAVQSAKDKLDPTVLTPSYDLYDLRFDLVRQKTKNIVNDSTTETSALNYHIGGFDLGNGLFIDLNDNISFKIPDLLNINTNENFSVLLDDKSNFLNVKTVYEKFDSLFMSKSEDMSVRGSKKVITSTDSVINVKSGFLSKQRITKSGTSITYKTGLFSTTIQKGSNGYFYKPLLGKREFLQKDNEVQIGFEYVIKNYGDRIEVLEKGMIGRDMLIYNIAKSGNKFYVFNNRYRGYEITVNEKDIVIKKNKREIKRYSAY